MNLALLILSGLVVWLLIGAVVGVFIGMAVAVADDHDNVASLGRYGLSSWVDEDGI